MSILILCTFLSNHGNYDASWFVHQTRVRFIPTSRSTWPAGRSSPLSWLYETTILSRTSPHSYICQVLEELSRFHSVNQPISRALLINVLYSQIYRSSENRVSESIKLIHYVDLLTFFCTWWFQTDGKSSLFQFHFFCDTCPLTSKEPNTLKQEAPEQHWRQVEGLLRESEAEGRHWPRLSFPLLRLFPRQESRFSQIK